MEEEQEKYIARKAEEEDIPHLLARNELLTSLLISFILLFVLAAGLLVYFQFYQGKGKWLFTLKHKNNDSSLLVKQTLPPDYITLRKQNDSFQKLMQLQSEKMQTPDILPAIHQPITADLSKPYVVQIGVFKNFDLSKYLQDMQYMEQHISGDLKTITIGRFAEQKEAEAFAKDMQALGIRAPVVAKVENGQVIPIKSPVTTKKTSVKKKSTSKKPLKKRR